MWVAPSGEDKLSRLAHISLNYSALDETLDWMFQDLLGGNLDLSMRLCEFEGVR
jgi:hypothetical protein